MTESTLNLVRNALDEDVGIGDLTSLHFVDATRQATARLVTRARCVVAGIDVAIAAFELTDSTLQFDRRARDGDLLESGAVVFVVRGPARSILTAERVALNFIQRLSGVATLTRTFVDAVNGSNAVILDTRKTTPLLRALEKEAVRAGGGQNHRMGLYDAVMLKDNHLPLTGALDELQVRLNEFVASHPGVKVELEADNPNQVEEFLRLNGVDVILLDNMSLEEMRRCVELRGNRPIKLEASGGVSLDTVRAIAATGVDFISVGALTHSAPAIDFALDIDSFVDRQH
jgi:nicotinate-nucleotide pyrophosphorylase (carboxylating)